VTETIPFLPHQPAQSPTNQVFHVACGFQIKFPKDKVGMLEIMQVQRKVGTGERSKS